MDIQGSKSNLSLLGLRLYCIPSTAHPSKDILCTSRSYKVRVRDSTSSLWLGLDLNDENIWLAKAFFPIALDVCRYGIF